MKLKYVLFVLAVCFLFPKLAFAAEQINNFKVNLQIQTDSSIHVIEGMDYDFGTTSHHGIFRDIPIKYQARGGNYNLRISDITVADVAGNSQVFTTSVIGNNERIKIGDPNALVSGQKNYTIGYTIRRALNYFNDHDELYWNVTGNGWTVPITAASAIVELPKEISVSNLKITCFAGLAGSVTPCTGNSNAPSMQQITSSVTFDQLSLAPGEGLTVVLGFPKGIVQQPSALQNIMDTIRDNWALALPVVVFFVLLYLWYTRGRDTQGYTIVVPYYEPPQGLTPTEVGTIIDDRADDKDITADIINLAVRGYLKITRLEGKTILFMKNVDYQLDVLKPGVDLENEFEKRLLEGIFSGKTTVNISELQNVFYTDLQAIRKMVYESVVVKGYYVKNPDGVRKVYLTLGAILIVLSFGLGGLLGTIMQSFYIAASLFVSGIIVMVFSTIMPSRTAKGAQARQQILGLKLYLSVAEKDRLNFFNAPEKSPQVFEKLLPYAIALGVEQAWAKQFEGIYNTSPSWYHDPQAGNFNTLFFVASMQNFSQTANSTFSNHPSSSASSGGSGFSGGSSGGGFGGGGGGSW